MAESIQIGWIGTGVMGRSMVGHLMDAGHTLTVHSRTKARAQDLLDRGALWANTPAAAATGREVVFSMVSMPDDVEAVHLGQTGTLAAARLPGLIVDMTSSRPALAREISAVAQSRGVEALDAPVTGGDIGARNATLSILVGGSEASFARVLPLFQLMGKTVIRQGAAGAGQQTKVVNQILIASTMVGVCEALLYARAGGLDPARVLESVSAGAAGSWTLANLAPRILKSDFEPGFFIDHFIKDLGIAIEECRAAGLDLPGLQLSESLYKQAQAARLGQRGTQALFLLYERAQATLAR